MSDTIEFSIRESCADVFPFLAIKTEKTFDIVKVFAEIVRTAIGLV